MYFMIKTAFWLSLVILLIPADPETKADSGDPDISSVQAIGAAQQAYVDMTRFCERNPMPCETGGAALDIFEAKARTGARMVYEYLGPAGNADNSQSEMPARLPDATLASGNGDRNLHTGSTKIRIKQDTLSPADRQPAWTAPAPLRKPV